MSDNVETSVSGREDWQDTKLRDMQLALLELIKLFISICEKEHLTYYMLYGTMLGAVRHKGFIPWDDDADFGMPRADYEKFLQVGGKYLPQGCHLENLQNSFPDHIFYNTRLTSDRQKIKISSAKKERTVNIGIDIDIIDGLPNQKLVRNLHIFRLLALKALYQYSLFDELVSVGRGNRKFYERIMIFFGKHFPIEKMLSPQKRWQAWERALKKYSFEKADYVWSVAGVYKTKEIMPKSVIGDGKPYAFEGLQINGVSDSEFYLRKIYGDYMTPPPAEDRNWHGSEVLVTQEK